MITCKQCNKDFKPNKMKEQIFCSTPCYKKSLEKPIRYCKNCKAELKLKWSKEFCGRSCSASFNNKKRDYGYRRSKLEEHIELVIKDKTDKKILFNDKSIIGSELDIYIPELKLAIEIQGVFHYQPVFSEEKFESIKRNDEEKRKKCKELGITLIEIDTRKQKQFSVESSQEYINTILNLIDNHNC